MKRHMLKRVMVVAIAAMMTFELSAQNPSVMVSHAYEEKAATVLASELNVRSGAGTSYSKVTSFSHGQRVTITDEVTGSDGNTWCKISFTGGEGYVLKSYLKTAVSYTTDDSFEAQLSAEGFPESYKTRLREIHAEYPNWVFKAENTGIDWEDAIKNESVVGRNLVYKTSKSSWKSTAAGAFDWGGNYWPGFDSSAWVAASEGIIRYYMDPRNFLDSSYVFQFLLQSYDASAHTAEGVEALAKGTFMEGTLTSASASADTSSSAPSASSGTASAPGSDAASQTEPGTAAGSETTAAETETHSVSLTGPTASIQLNRSASHAATVVKRGPGSVSSQSGTSSSSSSSSASSGSSGLNGKSYIDIIMEAAEQSGVNPYVLTSMIIQEQGTKGGNGLISGTTSGYTGIYNFFNIQAYATDSMTAVQRGLWWASQSGSYGRPWNTIEKAIVGGAVCYGENFVRNGQNTFYLKKFNVQGTNLYKHEYMTNVQGAASEGYKLGEAYSDSLKQTALTFYIPIFSNMPDEPAGQPTGDGSPNNKLSGLGVDGFSITPTFGMDTLSYDLIVDPSVGSVQISANTIDSGATVSGAGTVQLSGDNTTANVVVTAGNGDTRTYTINIVKQEGGAKGNGSTSSSSSSSSSSSHTVSGSKGGPGAASSTESSTEASGDTAVLIGPGN